MPPTLRHCGGRSDGLGREWHGSDPVGENSLVAFRRIPHELDC